MNKNYNTTLDYIKKYDNILFITTSNRWNNEIPKSTWLANKLKEDSKKDINIIDISKIRIHICEGNVSTNEGNKCGLKDAMLKSNNPTGNIRCWAAINNKDDEMYKVANAIFDSDLIIFFASVRWGKPTSLYSKLLERLTWLENRHTTLGEDNILKDKGVGFICVGHNFNGKNVIDLEKQNLKFFGFKIIDKLFWNYQYTENANDESDKNYIKDYYNFISEFNMLNSLKESVIKFRDFIWK